MPDTWTPVFDLTNKDRIARINHKAENQLTKVTEKINRKLTGDFCHRKLPLVAVKLYYPMYEKARQTKYFTVEDSCIGCGLCTKKCPVAAINMHGSRPVWIQAKCTLCLGCMHHCPKFAIQYGKKTKKHGQYVNPNVNV